MSSPYTVTIAGVEYVEDTVGHLYLSARRHSNYEAFRRLGIDDTEHDIADLYYGFRISRDTDWPSFAHHDRPSRPLVLQDIKRLVAFLHSLEKLRALNGYVYQS